MAAGEFKSKHFEVNNGPTEIVMATNLLCFGIERILCACRCFMPYEELPPLLQSALLRGGCSEMLLLRSVHHADLDGDCWVLDTRQVKNKNFVVLMSSDNCFFVRLMVVLSVRSCQ